jgi:hypothetical protein
MDGSIDRRRCMCAGKVVRSDDWKMAENIAARGRPAAAVRDPRLNDGYMRLYSKRRPVVSSSGLQIFDRVNLISGR